MPEPGDDPSGVRRNTLPYMNAPGGTRSLVLISGSMGSGKTSVLGEASDLLTTNGVVHAAIDLDALGAAHLPPGASEQEL